MKLKEESKNKSIMTTSYVLTNGSPVTFVLYDEDGDWQLFGEDEMDEDEDAYLVSVEEVLEMEPALRKLPDMQPGQAVVRDKDSTRWYFVEDEE
ncbi:MAG: hypothetical protein ACK5KT_01510 [Dysgonomonas sp.]